MRFVHKELLSLAKRSAAWQKGLALAGAVPEQRSYGQFAASEGEARFTVRGPHGWLSDVVEGAGEGSFEIGADPKALVDRVVEVWGRDAVELEADLGDRPRLVVSAEGYSKRLLMDPSTGFTPEALVPLPEVDVEASMRTAVLVVEQLQGVLRFALQAAPSEKESPQRAVVTLSFEEEEVKATATDGRLVMCARGTVVDAAQEAWQLHLGTAAAERLYGLLSTVADLDQVVLDVVPGEPDALLVVSFKEATPMAVMPLPIKEGLDVDRLFENAGDRTPMATVVVTPRTVHDLQAVGIERAVVLESSAHGLKVWARVDTDDAGEDKVAAVDVPASECHPGLMAVDAELLAKLIGLLNGDTLELQAAKGKRGTGMLVVEQSNESDINVLAALVGLNIGSRG
jgi:hypothetical protein